MRKIILILMLIVLLFLAGCSNTPNCPSDFEKFVYKITGPPMGGCFGKNNAENVSIKGDIPSCLKMGVSNCQGVQLNVDDYCKGMNISINGEDLNTTYNNFIFVMDKYGNVVNHKYSEDEHIWRDYPYPEEDEFITVYGTVDNQQFTVSYTRTKALC